MKGEECERKESENKIPRQENEEEREQENEGK